MGERLERSRPLWELWVVDGLADGRIAHVWKQHHALADGLSSVRLMDEIYQHGPDEDAPPAAAPTTSEPVTTRVGVGVGLRRHGRLARNFPHLVVRSQRARSVARVPSSGGPARLGSKPYRPGHPLQHRPDQPALLYVGDAAAGRPEVGGQGDRHDAERCLRRRGGRRATGASRRPRRTTHVAADRDPAGVHRVLPKRRRRTATGSASGTCRCPPRSRTRPSV